MRRTSMTTQHVSGTTIFPALTCTAALAVPEILCVSGDVALTCITVTRPMAKPMKPVSVMLNQKSAENSLAVLSRIICVKKEGSHC
jgi:hypothetical protein